ncbi:TetR/AcrR family transcriptional regulator [Micromonospora avicenniae]|uniref:TetR/AcrR family transcriptional regulator n=1 Tax=Micromonospora avicenniae TaxID=1198245 RepID=UPI001C37DEFA|nr:TetR/AcrR family transcriptional regulator [Micromonospora avicenniae]
MSTDGSLRERKKQQTRQSISDVATRLFLERGYDRVTIAEIAAASGVAKMTVTNYFPRKEDLVLDIADEFVALLARTAADRPTGEPVPDALRRRYQDAVARREAVVGFAGAPFVQLVEESPALTARLRELFELRERALAAQLAGEPATAGDDLTARLLAAQLAGAYRVLFHEAFRLVRGGHDEGHLAEALAQAGSRAFDLLASGVK